MLTIVLNTATLLGGLAAVWFFIDQFVPTIGAAWKASSHSTIARVLFAGRIPLPIALGVQWTIAVYVCCHVGMTLGEFALVLPFWLVPLSFVIARFVAPEAAMARVLGGVAAATVGAAAAYVIRDWAVEGGLALGLFFGTFTSGYLAQPKRQTSVLPAALSTTLLLSGLGAFRDPAYFEHAHGLAFLLAAAAAIVTLGFTWIVRTAELERRKRRKTLRPVRTVASRSSPGKDAASQS